MTMTLEEERDHLLEVAALIERERNELHAENKRLTKAYRRVEEQQHKLRQGILTAIDTLDRMDAYDTPLYEHLERLLDE